MSMKTTTIKLDGELLTELEANKPTGQSMASYVRSVLRKSVERKKAQEAALEFRAFLESDEDEKAWLDEWNRAELNTPLRPAKGTS
jgi:hypothetical protein